MAREKKPPPVHRDRIGQEILEGTKVAVAHHNQLRVCSVLKLNPKMLRVAPVNVSNAGDGFLVFGHQTVVIDSTDILAFMLKGERG